MCCISIDISTYLIFIWLRQFNNYFETHWIAVEATLSVCLLYRLKYNGLYSAKPRHRQVIDRNVQRSLMIGSERKHGVLEIYLFFVHGSHRFVSQNGCNRGTTVLFLLWKPWTKTPIKSPQLFLVSNELLLYARRDRCNIWESETVDRCISGLSKIHQLSDVLYLCPVPKPVLQVWETDGMRGILWWLVRGVQLSHSEGCSDQGFIQQRESVL